MAESVIGVKTDAKTNMVFSLLAFKGKGIIETNMRDAAVNNLIEKILTGTFSSRLMKRLREKEGLLYTISSSDYEYENFGYSGIYFKVIPEKYEKTLRIVLEELKKFSDKGITGKELVHFQEYIINRNLVVYDNIHDYSRLVKYPIFYNKDVILLEKLNEMYKSLTIREVNLRIKDLYKLKKASITAYGKVGIDMEDKIKNILDKA